MGTWTVGGWMSFTWEEGRREVHSTKQCASDMLKQKSSQALDAKPKETEEQIQPGLPFTALIPES